MLVDLSAEGHVIIHCESLLVAVLVVDHGPVVNLDALVLIDTSAVDAGKKSERCSGWIVMMMKEIIAKVTTRNSLNFMVRPRG